MSLCCIFDVRVLFLFLFFRFFLGGGGVFVWFFFFFRGLGVELNNVLFFVVDSLLYI